MKSKYFTSGLLLLIFGCVQGQKINNYNLVGLLSSNRILVTTQSETSVLRNDKSGAIRTVNTVWFKDIRFKEGVIDLDLRGKDEFLKSFLGIAFHGIDSTTFDVLYFRPFNFRHSDTARRHWAVQYMSLPDHDFMKLRKQHPLVYESAVAPVPNPNDWFHATIVIRGGMIQVYVNHSASPSLEVHLLNDWKDGMLGLFSDGFRSDFANLSIRTQ